MRLTTAILLTQGEARTGWFPYLNKEVQMSNDERIYWSAITISLFVVAWSFWVFSMEIMKWN